MLKSTYYKNSLRYTIVIEACCFLLILLLAYTGFSKLSDHTRFHSVMVTMPYLKHAEPLLSWSLPVVELVIALLLCTNRFKLQALAASLVLLGAFTIYLIVMKISGMHLPCSCGGVIQYLSWTQHIFFNLFFILMAMIGIIYKIKATRTCDAKTHHFLLPT